jgi:uncharacterized protein
LYAAAGESNFPAAVFLVQKRVNKSAYFCIIILFCVVLSLFLRFTGIQHQSGMKHIGLLSDTHGWLHPGIYDFFSKADEIWHCGDMGHIEIAEELSAFRPLKGVYGNIDGWDVRAEFHQYESFSCEDVKVLMTHIGGYPGRYDTDALQQILKEKPALFVCGHSHILKVMYDKKHELLHINPGAAGRYGMHLVITYVRFIIDGNNIRDLEISEYPKSSIRANK